MCCLIKKKKEKYSVGEKEFSLTTGRNIDTFSHFKNKIDITHLKKIRN